MLYNPPTKFGFEPHVEEQLKILHLIFCLFQVKKMTFTGKEKAFKR